MREIIASKLTVGDQFRYGAHSYKVTAIETVKAEVEVSYEGGEFPMGFYWDTPVVLIHEKVNKVEADPKPFKVYTRDYKANGDCDKRIFSYATRAEQERFMRRTNRCITFNN